MAEDLSNILFLCRREGSNLRPNAYEALALTTELRRQNFYIVAGVGFEPTTSRL